MAGKTDDFNMAEDREEIRSDIRLRFARTRPYFGKGTVMLLREIRSSGNVRKACENCGFSYSKGWTILNKCEKGLGYKVVDRQQGGESGGAAQLTESGEKLLAVFEELYRDISEYTEARFRQLMNENGLMQGDVK